jgi:hypothetical protein
MVTKFIGYRVFRAFFIIFTGALLFVTLTTGLVLLFLPLLADDNQTLLHFVVVTIVLMLAIILYWLLYKKFIKKLFLSNTIKGDEKL